MCERTEEGALGRHQAAAVSASGDGPVRAPLPHPGCCALPPPPPFPPAPAAAVMLLRVWGLWCMI